MKFLSRILTLTFMGCLGYTVFLFANEHDNAAANCLCVGLLCGVVAGKLTEKRQQ